MTGHLVLTTLHAQTAASSIQRLTDMNIERSILATSINCIIGQRLARRVCQACCEPTTPDPALLQALRVPDMLRRAEHLQVGRLPRVQRDGYRGRVPLFEVLTMSDEIALLVGAPTREIEAMAAPRACSRSARTVSARVGRHHDARRGSPRRRGRHQLNHPLETVSLTSEADYAPTDASRRAPGPTRSRRVPAAQCAGPRLRARRPGRLRLALHPLVRMGTSEGRSSRSRCSTRSRMCRC